MTYTDALTQVKAFARIDGLLLALLWICSFAATLMSPSSSWGSLLALLTPFLVGSRLVKFRNYALEGTLSFRRGFVYSCYVFFYASLLFCVAQFVYFRFIDHGQFLTLMTTMGQLLTEAYRQQGLPTDQVSDAMTAIASIKPGELSFLLLLQNLMIGLLLSFPIALVCRRNRGKDVINPMKKL